MIPAPVELELAPEDCPVAVAVSVLVAVPEFVTISVELLGRRMMMIVSVVTGDVLVVLGVVLIVLGAVLIVLDAVLIVVFVHCRGRLVLYVVLVW